MYLIHPQAYWRKIQVNTHDVLQPAATEHIILYIVLSDWKGHSVVWGYQAHKSTDPVSHPYHMRVCLNEQTSLEGNHRSIFSALDGRCCHIQHTAAHFPICFSVCLNFTCHYRCKLVSQLLSFWILVCCSFGHQIVLAKVLQMCQWYSMCLGRGFN